MREIKFRGKTYENEWVYGSFIDAGSKKFIWNRYPIEVYPESVGQFIGLKDKKLKEIYEKDIVKVIEEDGTEHIHYVEYKVEKSEYPAFDLYPEIDVEFNTLQFYVINKNIEVIGNIFDNKELLKEGR